MGYITCYDITLIGSENDKEAFKNDVIAEYDNDENIKNFFKDGRIDGKYYDLEDDIEEIAEKYPDLLVILKGDGEEPDDIWEHRFKGREEERHQIEMPPFTNPNLQIPNKNQIKNKN